MNRSGQPACGRLEAAPCWLEREPHALQANTCATAAADCLAKCAFGRIGIGTTQIAAEDIEKLQPAGEAASPVRTHGHTHLQTKILCLDTGDAQLAQEDAGRTG